MLRSLAVTPSSSRQGSLCTNASIWYLALMNSDLMGLHGWVTEKEMGSRVGEWAGYFTGPCPRQHGPGHHSSSQTHWTLSWGLALRRPLCTCAGSSRECSQMELAPLLASVCTICGDEMPREGAPCTLGKTPLSAGHSRRGWKQYQGAYYVLGTTVLPPSQATQGGGCC